MEKRAHPTPPCIKPGQVMAGRTCSRASLDRSTSPQSQEAQASTTLACTARRVGAVRGWLGSCLGDGRVGPVWGMLGGSLPRRQQQLVPIAALVCQPHPTPCTKQCHSTHHHTAGVAALQAADLDAAAAVAAIKHGHWQGGIQPLPAAGGRKGRGRGRADE